MKKNNCFITGGSGLLGSNWLLHLNKYYNVSASVNRKKIILDNINFLKVNLLSKADLLNTFKTINPVFIIHTAALSNVEKCESDHSNALRINVEISKKKQSSDWGNISLSKEQVDYAAKDVIYLHEIREKLNEILQREKRLDLAESCFKFLPTRVDLDLKGWVDKDIFSHSS